MELNKKAEEEAIYEGFKILARLMAQAVMKEISLKERTPQTQDADSSFLQSTKNTLSAHQEKLVFSVSETAKLLGLSQPATYQAVKRGQIPCIRFGRRMLIPRFALMKFLDGVSLQS